MVELRYRDSLRVWFHDGTYRWLDAARFVTDDDPTGPIEVLEALLTHDQYVNHYGSASDVACTPEEAERKARDWARAQAKYWRDHPGCRSSPTVEPAPPIHGPYLLNRISIHSYERLDHGAGERAILGWLARCDPQYPAPHDLEGDLDSLIALTQGDSLAYRLRKLGEGAEHPNAYITAPYFELVLVDPARQDCWLIAGGSD